jgi:hypothetical protein
LGSLIRTTLEATTEWKQTGCYPKKVRSTQSNV